MPRRNVLIPELVEGRTNSPPRHSICRITPRRLSRHRMLIVLGILLPVFGLIVIGYGMARTPLLKPEGVRGLGSFVYYVALPALLFRSTATPPPGESGGGAIIAAFFGGAVVLFVAGMLLARFRFGM